MTDARAQQLLRATLRLFDLAGLRDRYVLIGGAAVRAYDGSRVVNDIDALLADEGDVARLRPHLAEAGFRTGRFSCFAPTLSHPAGTVDVLAASLDPVWAEAWRGRVPATVLDTPVLVPTVEALAAVKVLSAVDPAQAGKAASDLRRLAVVAGRHKGRRAP